MSELQPVIIQSDGDYVRSRLGELYLKEEVDHYISELIADQQLELDEWYCKVEHQKYKRCLAMAKLCYDRWIRAYNLSKLQKARFYAQWQKRWLELAEKFKPNTSTAQ